MTRAALLAVVLALLSARRRPGRDLRGLVVRQADGAARAGRRLEARGPSRAPGADREGVRERRRALCRASSAPSTSPPTTRRLAWHFKAPCRHAASRASARGAPSRVEPGVAGRAGPRTRSTVNTNSLPDSFEGCFNGCTGPGLAGGAAGRREPVRPLAAGGHDRPARQRLLRRATRARRATAATGSSAGHGLFFRLYRAAVVLQDDSEPQGSPRCRPARCSRPARSGGTQTATFTVGRHRLGRLPGQRRGRRAGGRVGADARLRAPRSRRPFRPGSRRPPPSRWTPRRSRTVPMSSGSVVSDATQTNVAAFGPVAIKTVANAPASCTAANAAGRHHAPGPAKAPRSTTAGALNVRGQAPPGMQIRVLGRVARSRARRSGSARGAADRRRRRAASPTGAHRPVAHAALRVRGVREPLSSARSRSPWRWQRAGLAGRVPRARSAREGGSVHLQRQGPRRLPPPRRQAGRAAGLRARPLAQHPASGPMPRAPTATAIASWFRTSGVTFPVRARVRARGRVTRSRWVRRSASGCGCDESARRPPHGARRPAPAGRRPTPAPTTSGPAPDTNGRARAPQRLAAPRATATSRARRTTARAGNGLLPGLQRSVRARGRRRRR